MTEKEMLDLAFRRSAEGVINGESANCLTIHQALALAREAGAPFDPEPIEPVVIFEEGDDTSADRLLLKPGGKRETFGLDFDGWETAPQGTYRWERRHGIGGMWSEWKWQGNNRLMTELARRLLAEWQAKDATGNWFDAAAREWLGRTKPSVHVLAATFRRHAPKVPTVRTATEAVIDAHNGVNVLIFDRLIMGLRAAGLPEGEP